MNETKQAVWKYVGTLGDVNPVDHGGTLVLEDVTGVYPPECVDIEPVEDENGDPERWIVRRWIVEPCTVNEQGVVSDNEFHPNHAAWFDKALLGLAAYCDITPAEFIHELTDGDTMARAAAWLAIGEFFGKDNLDNYPMEYTDRSEVEAIVKARKSERGTW